MNSRLQSDIDRIRGLFGDVRTKELPEETFHIRIEEFTLPAVCNVNTSRLLLVIAKDYPTTRPAFYVDPKVMKQDGTPFRGRQGTTLIEDEEWVGFCWNWPWDPGRDNLVRLLKAIRRGFLDSL